MNDKINVLTEKDVEKIINNIHSFTFTVANHNGFLNAQVMAGGVSVDDVDFETLQHKRIKGLYFAGEILDIDGKVVVTTCSGHGLPVMFQLLCSKSF